MSETVAPEASAPVAAAVAGESRRTLANRRNAQKSTGPKTSRGKAASARNAVSHGLFCHELVIEDPAEREQFERFARQLERRFAPADVLERLLLERFINAAWRLRRAAGAEADVVAKLRWRDGTTLRLGHLLGFGDPCLDNLLRYEQGFERSMYRALSQLQRAQKLRKQGQRDEPEGQDPAPDAPSATVGFAEPGGAVGLDAPVPSGQSHLAAGLAPRSCSEDGAGLAMPAPRLNGSVGAGDPVGPEQACAAPCKNEPNEPDEVNHAIGEEAMTYDGPDASSSDPVGENEANEATDQTDDHANDTNDTIDPVIEPTTDPAPSGITHEIYRTLTASLDRAGVTGPPTRPRRRRYLSPFEHDLRHSHHLCDTAAANLRFIRDYEAQLDDPDQDEASSSSDAYPGS